MDMRAMGDDFTVCLCKQKTKGELIKLIREKGISNLDELRETADVGNKCGGCGEDLEQLIEIAREQEAEAAVPEVDPGAFRKFGYGLFVLTARADDRDNGCIINTGIQITTDPNRVIIAVNKGNYTHDMIKATGRFNLSFLSESAAMDTFRHFGFQSGHEVNKFDAHIPVSYAHSANGLPYITTGTNAYVSAEVKDMYDYGTHTLFVAEVTEAAVLNDDPSVTYAYYFEHIKPKPQTEHKEEKHGWVCRICGYFYEGEELPQDFICPVCKHGADDFERVG